MNDEQKKRYEQLKQKNKSIERKKIGVIMYYYKSVCLLWDHKMIFYQSMSKKK